MIITQDIIRKLWNAQGYGNLAVWGDGSTEVISPGDVVEKNGEKPIIVLKPIPLVGIYPMLDHALGDAKLQKEIEDAIRNVGGEI